jgi:hypothetical protein
VLENGEFQLLSWPTGKIEPSLPSPNENIT